MGDGEVEVRDGVLNVLNVFLSRCLGFSESGQHCVYGCCSGVYVDERGRAKVRWRMKGDEEEG